MQDPTHQPTEPTSNDSAELSTLRTTVSELREKSTARKRRIAELEAALAERDSQLAQANATIKEITIDTPLRDLSESISTAPELWVEQFQKSGYRLEMKGSKLQVLTSDGKPVLHNGSAVPFERDALAKFLTDEKSHAQAKTFRAITIVNRASGSQAAPESGQRKSNTASQKQTFQFGLRNPPRSN
jgi:hypothetical protein